MSIYFFFFSENKHTEGLGVTEGRPVPQAASVCWGITDPDTITEQHMVQKPQPHRLSYPHGPCNSACNGQPHSPDTRARELRRLAVATARSSIYNTSLCHGRCGSEHVTGRPRASWNTKVSSGDADCSETNCLGYTKLDCRSLQ